MNGAAHTTSERWLGAIAAAERRKCRDASEAADYLRHLNDLLNGQTARWNDPPDFDPPVPLWEQQGGDRAQGGAPFNPYAHQPQGEHIMIGTPSNGVASSTPTLAVSTASHGTADQNPYSAFDDSDSGDSDDEISDEEIVYQTPSKKKSQIDDKDMSTRRILLRVYCSLGEIHSQWAVECCHNKKWIAGADEFEAAFNTLRLGQSIIDEEHAWLAQVTEAIAQYGHRDAAQLRQDVEARKECAARDSDVVAVPLAFFSASGDKFVHAAEKRIAFLEDKLFENTTARADKMAEIGMYMWNNNPNPSHDYAEKRKVIEKELDEALEGMNRTRKMDLRDIGG